MFRAFKSKFQPKLWILPSGVVYYGSLPPNRQHSHRALQVLVSAESTISADQGPGSSGHVARVIIVRQFVRHRIYASLSPAVALFYEPSLLEETFLKPKTTASIEALNLSSDAESSLAQILRASLEGKQAAELLNFGARLANVRFRTEQDLFSKDPRIQTVLERLHQTGGSQVTFDMIASDVGLSPGRLIHLFSDEVQMPIRSYFVWIKLRRALDLVATGASLTEVAHETGFSDSAHLSRLFSRTFGFAPSLLTLMDIRKSEDRSMG